MRRSTAIFAAIAALTWTASAQAGTVNSTWDLGQSSGATHDTTSSWTIPGYSMKGTMCLTFSNAASTKSSIPRSRTMTMGCFTSTENGTYAGALQFTWKAKLQSPVGLHVTYGGSVPGSSQAKLQFQSIGHCIAFCFFWPGAWTASVTKTNSFTTYVHLPVQRYSTANGYKYIASGTLKITPPNGHLVSSNYGYHTMHIRAKQS